MIANLGHSCETDVSYRWDGLSRGDREFAIIQLTLSGCGALRWKRASYSLNPGELFVVRVPHDHCYYLPPTSDHWEFVYVGLYGMETMRIIRALESLERPVLAARHSDACCRIYSTFREILRYGFTAANPSPFVTSSLAYGLVMCIADQLISAVPEVAPTTPIETAKEYARRHLAEPIGVDDMAAAAGFSRSHFTRAFRQREGISPRDYLEHMRLKQAMSLLFQNERPVKDIALSCGFRDQNYFSRVFRRATGVSPTAYRKIGV